MQANQGRIDAVAKTGNDLVEGGHYAADNIKARVDEIQEKWNEVNDMSKGKGEECKRCSVAMNEWLYKERSDRKIRKV